MQYSVWKKENELTDKNNRIRNIFLIEYDKQAMKKEIISNICSMANRFLNIFL